LIKLATLFFQPSHFAESVFIMAAVSRRFYQSFLSCEN